MRKCSDVIITKYFQNERSKLYCGRVFCQSSLKTGNCVCVYVFLIVYGKAKVFLSQKRMIRILCQLKSRILFRPSNFFEFTVLSLFTMKKDDLPTEDLKTGTNYLHNVELYVGLVNICT